MLFSFNFEKTKLGCSLSSSGTYHDKQVIEVGPVEGLGFAILCQKTTERFLLGCVEVKYHLENHKKAKWCDEGSLSLKCYQNLVLAFDQICPRKGGNIVEIELKRLDIANHIAIRDCTGIESSKYPTWTSVTCSAFRKLRCTTALVGCTICSSSISTNSVLAALSFFEVRRQPGTKVGDPAVSMWWRTECLGGMAEDKERRKLILQEFEQRRNERRRYRGNAADQRRSKRTRCNESGTTVNQAPTVFPKWTGRWKCKRKSVPRINFWSTGTVS